MRVTKFQAADGTLWDKEKDQLAHDRKLRVLPAMQSFIGEQLDADSEGSMFYVTDSDDEVISRGDLPQFLADHHDTLLKTLTGALVKSKRGRKPGSKNKEKSLVATAAADRSNLHALGAAVQ